MEDLFFGLFLGLLAVLFVPLNPCISPAEWQEAERLCSTNDGVRAIEVRTFRVNAITCKNSAKFEQSEKAKMEKNK